MKFLCQSLSNNEVAYQNILEHSSEYNKTEQYFMINNVVYKSIPYDLCQVNAIQMSSVVRNNLGVKVGTSVHLTTYQPKQTFIKKLNLNIRSFKDGHLLEYENELVSYINDCFKNHYFYPKQSLLMKYNNLNLIIDIVTQVEGYMNDKTIISLESSDCNVVIVANNTLNKEFFKDDFDFSTIGIGGLNNQLAMTFRRALSTRAYSQQTIDKLGIKHVKGILLYGPSGTGKTLIARKIGALISNIKPKIVNGSEVMNKYVGGSEENIRNLFQEAMDDKTNQLHVIIFDEIDAICRKRGDDKHGDRMVNQLLSIIDGVNALNNIFIIAMTNRKELIDDALLRAGRIEIHINIDLPTLEGRKEIFKIHTEKMYHHGYIENIDYDVLAAETPYYTGAEIEAIVNNAVSRSLYESIQKEDENIIVTMNHFLQACQEVKPIMSSNHDKLKYLLGDNKENSILEYQYGNLHNEIKHYTRLKVLVKYKQSYSTAVTAKFLLNSPINYKDMIIPKDIINLNDLERSNYIIDVFNRAYDVQNSIIVIDDLELCINYTNIGHSVIFSNKIYQTILSLLQILPPLGHQLTVIIYCNTEELYQSIVGDKVQ